MNIFFDVDQTILGMDNSLRPGTRETMASLIDGGHQVNVWSGLGVRKDVVKRHKLNKLVSGVYHKPLYDHHQRLDELGVPMIPDFVVDDDPEVVVAFGGMWVPPFFGGTVDREMERVFRAAMQFAQKGTSEDDHFRARDTEIPFT